jgi:hypothetical protein
LEAEMTPDELREMARYGDREDAIWAMEKAADAWEQDRRRLEAAEKLLHDGALVAEFSEAGANWAVAVAYYFLCP